MSSSVFYTALCCRGCIRRGVRVLCCAQELNVVDNRTLSFILWLLYSKLHLKLSQSRSSHCRASAAPHCSEVADPHCGVRPANWPRITRAGGADAGLEDDNCPTRPHLGSSDDQIPPVGYRAGCSGSLLPLKTQLPGYITAPAPTPTMTQPHIPPLQVNNPGSTLSNPNSSDPGI